VFCHGLNAKNSVERFQHRLEASYIGHIPGVDHIDIECVDGSALQHCRQPTDENKFDAAVV